MKESETNKTYSESFPFAWGKAKTDLQVGREKRERAMQEKDNSFSI